MQSTLVLVIVICICAAALGCTDVLCNHPDTGSCGNACCKLMFAIQAPTETVMQKLNQSIVAGGPDGLYIPQMTAEGTLTFGDLRQYPDHPDFIGQAWHTTKNGLYNDTINFTLFPTDDGSSTALHAFSISQIGGAYGDDGQNYFNIVQLLTSIWGDAKATALDMSCPLAPAR
jgi:hypothetical protein